MFAGGIADKLGNRYEAKWLVRQFLDVVAGQAGWIQFEGINRNFNGFEFALNASGVTSWHQTKVTSPNGNWTIAALIREGVTGAFRDRFAASDTDRCVFISQDPAKDLSTLVGKAKIANTSLEFAQSLGKTHSSSFQEITNAWNVDSDTSYRWLRRSEFITIPQSEIDAFIDAYAGLYFKGTPDAFPVLRDFLEIRLNQIITSETARRRIREDKKLAFKDWSLDPTLRERLQVETQAYLNTYNPFGAAGHTIVREQSAKILDHLARDDGPSVILLTGVAGSGKSGVIRSVIEALARRNQTCLALRIDHHLQCVTRTALGQQVTGREESPAATLKGIEPTKLSVLIIDQVDAISEVSGRSGAVKQAILGLADDARNYGTVRLIFACRSFDLESDPRLKALKEARGVVHVDTPVLDWARDVKPLLIYKSIDVECISSKQQNLLCLPLNLSIFLTIDDAKNPSFTSRNDLFERLLEQKDRLIRRERTVAWGVTAPLLQLAKWMSERQRLDAPREVLSNYGGALDILTSEGLIVRSRDRINFFHESFFDYIYARAFCQDQLSIEDFLVATEQHLFRRTQVRQILETLRQSDPSRYASELRDVLNNAAIRYHVKVAVAQWLGAQSNPLASERDAVLALDDGSDRFPPLLRYAALTTPGWFDRLDEIGWIEAGLADAREQRRRAIEWWLSALAGERSGRIAAILDAWWSGDEARAATLLEWFGFLRGQQPGEELTDLCVRAVKAAPIGIFKKDGLSGHNSIYSWASGHTRSGARIVQAYFDGWFQAHPGKHPFERDEFSELGIHGLGDTAKKASDDFLESTLEAFCRAVDIVAERTSRGEWDRSFTHRSFSGHRFGADAFLGLFHDALVSIAREQPTRAQQILSRLDPKKHEVLTHLHLEVISANGKYFAPILVGLLDSPHLFDAGWDGADWKSFADAVREALPHLPSEDAARVETVILAHFPELGHASDFLQRNREGEEQQRWPRSTIMHYIGRSGFDQLCILETIGSGALTSKARDRLTMLRRKFPNEALPRPRHNKAHWVGSPIKRDRITHMSDAHWLRAIIKYESDKERTFGHDFIDGGAQQLAAELQQVSKEDPCRFAALVTQIPNEANPAYLRDILWGLSEADGTPEHILRPVVVNAHGRPRRPYGLEIARLFEKCPKIAADATAFEILLWYVEHGEANEDEKVDQNNVDREVLGIDHLLDRAGKLHIRGVNGARGWAAEALGAVLWSVPTTASRAWEILERRIAEEETISIRCCLMSALVPLYNHDKERCARLVSRLCEKPTSSIGRRRASVVERIAVKILFPPTWVSRPIRNFLPAVSRWSEALKSKLRKAKHGRKKGIWLSPVVTHKGNSLLPYLTNWVPKIGETILYRLLFLGDETQRMVAAWHIFRLAFQREQFAALADDLLRRGPAYRRLAASVAAQAINEDEFRYRAENQLLNFFNDTDKPVRIQAAHVFRSIETDEFSRFYGMAERFIESRAFEEESFGFFHALENASCEINSLVLKAAERLMGDLKQYGAEGGRRHLDLHQIQDLLKREYARSEHNPDLRSRLLDIVDTMLARELYGVEDIVKAHER